MDIFLSGVTAGVVSSIICNPIDVLRINKQINKNIILNRYTCFKGLGYGMITIPTFWGLYFPIYELTKIQKTFSPGDKMFNSWAAYISVCIASTFTTPLWVLRQKAQTGKLHEVSNMKFSQFYCGLIPTYFINLNFVVQIPMYEYLKSKTNNNTYNTFFNTAISKTVATSIFYPLDTLRVITRNGGDNVRLMNITQLYRGFNLYLLRSIPYHCSVFCTYEFIRKNLI